jgi:hypothetical protein
MRELREEARVGEALARACEKWPRAEDAWNALTWAIARDPKIGRPLTESGDLRNVISEGAASIGIPTISVTYSVSEPTIQILDAEFTEPRSTQAGRG